MTTQCVTNQVNSSLVQQSSLKIRGFFFLKEKVMDMVVFHFLVCLKNTYLKGKVMERQRYLLLHPQNGCTDQNPGELTQHNLKLYLNHMSDVS